MSRKIVFVLKIIPQIHDYHLQDLYQESGIFYFQRQQTERYKIILEQVLH